MPYLHVGIDAWIIQDGNYGDFEVGGTHRFALEFHPHDIAPVEGVASADPVLRHLAGALHEIEGNVIRAGIRDWVIDFGVPAFQESQPPQWGRPGVRVRGMVYIGIDPFFYFERLKDEPGMPNLFRNWTIHRILLETTPWQESGKHITRADVPPTFVEVAGTNAWKDDDGHAHYILECEVQRAR